jgi:hypothetical protein
MFRVLGAGRFWKVASTILREVLESHPFPNARSLTHTYTHQILSFPRSAVISLRFVVRRSVPNYPSTMVDRSAEANACVVWAG